VLQYSEIDAYTVFTLADLRPIHKWTDTSSRCALWVLERSPFTFPLLRSPADVSRPNPFGVPTVEDWKIMWAAWDLITMGMISPDLMLKKPIDLRHICLFYLGHIPTFLDMHLSKLLDQPHTEPENFKVSHQILILSF
jgi:hypothetical protein